MMGSGIGDFQQSLSHLPGLQTGQAAGVEKTKTQVQTEVTPEEVRTLQKTYAAKLKAVVTTKYPNIQARDQAFMNVACEKPAVQEKYQKLLDLKQKYPNCCKAVRENSWEGNCESRGLGMTQKQEGEELSLEEFRTVWNAAVDEATIAVGEESGCPPAFWGACGTVSAFSDVDTAIIGKGLSPADANIYASARNAVHTSALGGHSGTQLDTEAYIPHPAKYNTTGALSGSPKAHARYIACEKANVALQYHISLSGHPKEYLQAKQDYLQGIADPVHRQGMSQIFAQAEALLDHIELEVTDEILLQSGHSQNDLDNMANDEKGELAATIRHENPTAYKLARENVIPRLRTQMGESIRKVDDKIATLQKQMTQFTGNSFGQQEAQGRSDELNNLRNEMFSLMNLLQDEGTNSQAEGKVTLLQEGGQMHAGAAKKAVKKLAEQDQEQKGVGARLAQQGGRIADVYYKDRLRESLTPTGFEKPTPESLTIATHEEAAQRKHKFNDAMQKAQGGNSNKGAMQALGHSRQAKYADRMAKNAYRALSEKEVQLKAEGKPVPKSLIGVKWRAKKLMDKSDNLLRCMRKDFIGTEATEEMLLDAVLEDMTVRGDRSVDSVQLRSKARKVVHLFEPGGREHGKIMEKHEQMNVMVKEMKDLGLIDSNEIDTHTFTDQESGRTITQLVPANSAIRKVLQARVGYSIEDPAHADLIPLHDRSLEITCQRMNLDTVDKALLYDKQMDKLAQDLENVFVDQGWMPKVTLENAQAMDFIKILQSASQQEGV